MAASTPDELARFEQAGPYRPPVDTSAIVQARLSPGPYHVAPGDILELEMPAVLRALSPDATSTAAPAPHVCRVTTAGKITVPMVGEIDAAGKTLEEIEDTAVAAYHPKFTIQRPAIVATVKEYSTVKVSVTGAVTTPGVYALASDERSLVAALMKAGGIVREGATAIKIYRSGKRAPGKPIVLPVEGLNIAFADVALQGGETIEVLRLDPQVFTVVGLVKNPGTYEYPPGARYSLVHALGFGGGVDFASDPHYVHVIRQGADGKIVSATFNIFGDGLQRAAAVPIKQGDIIAVADTTRALVRRIVSNVFRGGVYVGAQYNLDRRR